MTKGVPNTEQDFWAKVDCSAGPEGCWPWLGTVNPRGYAMFSYRADNWMAHALAVHFARGEELGLGHFIHRDHLCHDPASCTPGVDCAHRRCCNPAHIETVVAAVNTERSGSASGINARKTVCKYGHEFTEENTRWFMGRNGRPGRRCRTCTRRMKAAARGRQRFRSWAAS